ncbi:MAG TPA: hypothetical protein VLJ61_07225 [Pyrinomonadaceae bacterium]|nr:hypothetical protein [Pyrinomonadaceae bacterium]
MKKVSYYLTAVLLTFALTAIAYAGQMDTTIVPPTPSGQMDTRVITPETPEQKDTSPSTEASGSAITIETLAELALDIYQSVKP